MSGLIQHPLRKLVAEEKRRRGHGRSRDVSSSQSLPDKK